jgi:membrane protein DedA with SNARE-associated domain
MEIYIFLFILIFAINVVPAFMPPTWIILSFFYVNNDLLFLPTIILGVIAATSGRIVLALISKYWLKKALPISFYSNYQYLGEYLKRHTKLTLPIVFGYAFSPISSNSLFIMAGFSNLNLKLIAASFFIGRLISYSFWITVSHQLSNRLDTIFTGTFSNLNTFISALISMGIVVIIGRINWKNLLKSKIQTP